MFFLLRVWSTSGRHKGEEIMDLKKLGVFGFLDGLAAAQTLDLARKVERLGYSALWLVESGVGRDAIAHASYLLGGTTKLIIGSGVASVWAREPSTMACGARATAELSGNRFILGMGINNEKSAAMRGRKYERPVEYMRDYVSKVKSAMYMAPAPREDPPIVLGANNRKMLALAGTDTMGTLTYFVTPEHTAWARGAIGPDKWICAEQAVMLEADAAKARAAARQYMSFYLQIPAYPKNLSQFGFTDDDFRGGGSDRLVDAIVAWGGEDKLRERIAAHYHAGATHVCVLPLNPAGGLVPDSRVLELLAPA
jgi:probable F420-dependent oxidoreductase